MIQINLDCNVDASYPSKEVGDRTWGSSDRESLLERQVVLFEGEHSGFRIMAHIKVGKFVLPEWCIIEVTLPDVTIN